MRLCYSINKGLVPGFLMSALSAAIATSEPLEIFLLTGDFSELSRHFKPVTEKDADFCESILQMYNSGSKINLIDMTKDYKDELRTYKAYAGHFSPYSFLRLFINDFVDSGRILYIDADTIVMRDLSELYHMDLQGNKLAMVIDAVGKNWMAADYCNSGVVLFDLDAIKGTDLMEKCRDQVKNHLMFMPDQSAINKYFRDSIYRIDRRFNEQQSMQDDTVIRHYCRVLKFFPFPHYIQAKPWDKPDYFHRQRNEYQCDDVIKLVNYYVGNREGAESKTKYVYVQNGSLSGKPFRLYTEISF